MIELDQTKGLPVKRSIWRLRTAELVVGHTANKVQEYLLDYLLYPFVIFKLGLWRGGILMAVLTLFTCLLSLKLYDVLKRDWLGIEAIKGMKHYEGSSRIRALIAAILRRGNVGVCILLSIKFDPFITTTYMRQGCYNGMSQRDWKIFFASWLIANAYWSLACFGGISVIKNILLLVSR